MGQLLEVLQLSHGVGGHAVRVLLLDLDHLDGDDVGRLGLFVALVDDGVGTLTEELCCFGKHVSDWMRFDARGIVLVGGCILVTYLFASARFICSIKSSAGRPASGFAAFVGLGVPFAEETAERVRFSGDDVERCCVAEAASTGGARSGDTAMVASLWLVCWNVSRTACFSVIIAWLFWAAKYFVQSEVCFRVR